MKKNNKYFLISILFNALKEFIQNANIGLSVEFAEEYINEVYKNKKMTAEQQAKYNKIVIDSTKQKKEYVLKTIYAKIVDTQGMIEGVMRLNEQLKADIDALFNQTAETKTETAQKTNLEIDAKYKIDELFLNIFSIEELENAVEILNEFNKNIFQYDISAEEQKVLNSNLILFEDLLKRKKGLV